MDDDNISIPIIRIKETIQNVLTNSQPLYLSFNIQKLRFSKGSIFYNVVEGLKQFKQCDSSPFDQANSISMTQQVLLTKMVYKFQLYELQKQQQKKIHQTQSIGQTQQIQQGQSRIFGQQKNMTSVQIINQQYLNGFIYNYQPQSDNNKQFKLKVSIRINAQQQLYLGQCIIDPKIYIQMFLNENYDCMRNLNCLANDIEISFQTQFQETSQTNNIQIQYEVYVNRSRFNLERVIRQNKKGINVLDFKDHMKELLRLRQQISQDRKTKKQDENLNINQPILIKQQNLQFNIQQHILKQTKHTLKQSKQIIKIDSHKRMDVKKQQLNLKKTKSLSNNKSQSTLQKYKKYLKNYVEGNLHFYSPKKQLVEKQIQQLLQINTTLKISNLLQKDQYKSINYANSEKGSQFFSIKASQNSNISKISDKTHKNGSKKQFKQKLQYVQKQERKQQIVTKQNNNIQNSAQNIHKVPESILNNKDKTIQNIKMFVFIILSIFMLYYVMNPSKKSQLLQQQQVF